MNCFYLYMELDKRCLITEGHICLTRLTRRVSLVKQELPTLPEHLSCAPFFSGVPVTRSFILCVYFVDRCLFFFFWQLCCLFFFDLRILITPVVSSSSSYKVLNYNTINWKITILSEQFQHSNRKIVEKGKIVTLNIHIHNRSLS